VQNPSRMGVDQFRWCFASRRLDLFEEPFFRKAKNARNCRTFAIRECGSPVQAVTETRLTTVDRPVRVCSAAPNLLQPTADAGSSIDPPETCCTRCERGKRETIGRLSRAAGLYVVKTEREKLLRYLLRRLARVSESFREFL
jgi:hypothetical protein